MQLTLQEIAEPTHPGRPLEDAQLTNTGMFSVRAVDRRFMRLTIQRGNARKMRRETKESVRQ